MGTDKVKRRTGTLSRRGFLRLGLAGAGLAMLGGCGNFQSQGSGGGEVTIAYQPGIGYAQLLIVKQEGWLQKALPDTKFAWRTLNSGSAIRDGMISGDIQIGAASTGGPFLVGYDRGVDWKILSALNDNNIWLMVKDPKFDSLEDFADGDKIAMPAPDSLQAVILKRGAQEQFGDPKALDSSIVSLAHPDGLQALESGQIAGHLTSPPFQFQEQDAGARPILQSFDLFGQHNSNAVFARQGFHDDNPEVIEELYGSLQEATELLTSDPSRAADILSKESGGETSAQDFETYVTADGVNYTTEPHRTIELADFMQEIGFISKAPQSWKDIVFDNLKNTNGS